MRTGRCLCDEVQYELQGPLAPLVNCHCQFCRRAHGAAFATLSWLPRKALRIVSGEDSIRSHAGQQGLRFFCVRCGTRLFNGQASSDGFISLVVATLDEQPENGPVMHINMESRARWHVIGDDAPQHESLPDDVRRALAAATEEQS